MVLDGLRRRARRGKWAQKIVVIIITLLMLLTGTSVIFQSIF